MIALLKNGNKYLFYIIILVINTMFLNAKTSIYCGSFETDLKKIEFSLLDPKEVLLLKKISEEPKKIDDAFLHPPHLLILKSGKNYLAYKVYLRKSKATVFKINVEVNNDILKFLESSNFVGWELGMEFVELFTQHNQAPLSK